MKTIYGVNSYTPMNKKLKNGYTVYDWIVRQKGVPSFCFRTLCGENAITNEEIEFLRSKDCRIGMVIRNLSEKNISGCHGDKEALNAIYELKSLNFTNDKKIAFFAEINSDWSINHNWMISFAQTIAANGYKPAFIANTDSSKNFNFDRQCSHFVNATIDVGQFGAIYCATEPKISNKPEEWAPFCPSALETTDINLWMCGKTKIDDIFIDDVYASNLSILDNML